MKKHVQVVLILLTLLTGCTSMSPQKPELGIKDVQLSQCPSTPNCVSSQATDKKHYIEPIYATMTSPEVRNHLLGVLNDLKRVNVITAEDNYIRAEFASKIFKFVDDVEFYFPETQSAEITLHVRSASRVGYSDLGANRRRIEYIRRTFHETGQDIE